MKNLFLALMLMASTAFGADGVTFDWDGVLIDATNNLFTSPSLQDPCTTGCGDRYHSTGDADTKMQFVEFQGRNCSINGDPTVGDRIFNVKFKGTVRYDLYNSAGAVTKTVLEPLMGGDVGSKFSVGMAAADNLTYKEDVGVNGWGVLLSLANYADSKLVVTISGNASSGGTERTALCVCAGGINANCLDPFVTPSGGRILVGGSGHVSFTIPIRIETVP